MIVAIAERLPSGLCVEVGCGNGRYLLPISLKANREIFGVDVQRPKEIGRFQFIQADVHHLPFSQGSVASAYMIQSIHQFHSWQSALREVEQVLQENGILIVHTLSRSQVSEVFTLKFTPEALELDLQRYPPINELCQFLLDQGFANVEVKEIQNTRVFSREELIKYIETRANSAFRHLYESRGSAWFQEMLERAMGRMPNDSTLAEPHNSTLIVANKKRLM